MFVVGTPADKVVFDDLMATVTSYDLDVQLQWHSLEKTNQQTLMQFAKNEQLFIAVIKHTPNLVCRIDDELIKISPNWQSLTKRIVSAGRKSELLLQACKLNQTMNVIDANAGFGHDGLLLAGTGAKVLMIEKQPIIALLLFYEYHIMSQHQNWQKLLGRIQIICDDALLRLPKLQADLVYLDPMFPQHSYQSKVGKHMQVLHTLTCSPDHPEQAMLLQKAKQALTDGGKVVIKRPIGAEYLADCPPIQSFANDAIRFDIYNKS